MSDDEFLTQLEACVLPDDCFHHDGHVRAAWLYLTRFSVLEAIARLSQSVRAFAASKGKPERYHETITWAYVLLLNERIERTGSAADWSQFRAANEDLLDWKNPILSKFYRRETLDSDLARRVFLMPDRF